MTIDVSFLISGVSIAFAIYFGMKNNRRNDRLDTQKDASSLTTVIVKLENIGDGITEIKKDMGNVKNDLKDYHERLVKVEEAAKSAHKRMDTCEKFCKRFNNGESE